MSRLVRIALVGRPNVGKSALFNAICKKKIAIVDEAEGITRDRLYAKSESFGYPFELIDTGGIDTKKGVLFHKEILEQAEIAIQEADSLIMVVDGTRAPTELDIEVARRLHRSKKPICLAVNKIDNFSLQNQVFEFLPLGIEKMVAVSAQHGYQIAELIETALESVDKEIIPENEPSLAPGIAIIGRPNVGKSTLLNSLVQEERSIVSPIAGTTRDSIDSIVHKHGKDYLFIDTAGIRKRKKEKEVVDKFAFIRTKKAIERASICLLMIDALEGMTTEEKKIASMIEEEEKSCILLVNKWDLAKGFRMEHCLQGLEAEISFLQHCPKVILSAKTGRNVDKIFEAIDIQLEAHNKRIGTGQLNKYLTQAMQNYHPPVLGGRRLRIYYMTQARTNPPHFILFVNNPNLMDAGYKRYLVNRLRETFGFQGVPLTFTLRAKEQKKRGTHSNGTDRTHGFDRDLPMGQEDSGSPFETDEFEDDFIDDDMDS